MRRGAGEEFEARCQKAFAECAGSGDAEARPQSMKCLKILALFCVGLTSLADQLPEVFLWPNGAPGSEGKSNELVVITRQSGERSIYQVHKPSITPFLPAHAPDSGATAVIVIPGGGHSVLAYDHE